MSFLEDLFLQDEAHEAQELERVIEGGDDDQPRSLDSNDDSEREDEAEEEKKRVDPTQNKTKHVIKNPRFILNPARLTGPRGIHIIQDHFKDYKFKGKGHEKEDLDIVLKKLEHWAFRLYPKFQFEDCLKKIETLGKKRPVMVCLHKIRSDQFLSEETVTQLDSDGEQPQETPQEDEFDRLLQLQIDRARSTPATPATRHPQETPQRLLLPKAASSPSISDEQRERMIRNRQLAEERRLAKLKQMNTENNDPTADQEVAIAKKHNRSNIIDSSDEENEIVHEKQSITIDVHYSTDIRNNDSDDSDNDNIVNESSNKESACPDDIIKSANDLNDSSQNVVSSDNNTKTNNNADNLHVKSSIFGDDNNKLNTSSDDIEVLDKNNRIINVDQAVNESQKQMIVDLDSVEVENNSIQEKSSDNNTEGSKDVDKLFKGNSRIDNVETKNVVIIETDVCAEEINQQMNQADTNPDDVMDIDFSDDF